MTYILYCQLLRCKRAFDVSEVSSIWIEKITSVSYCIRTIALGNIGGPTEIFTTNVHLFASHWYYLFGPDTLPKLRPIFHDYPKLCIGICCRKIYVLWRVQNLYATFANAMLYPKHYYDWPHYNNTCYTSICPAGLARKSKSFEAIFNFWDSHKLQFTCFIAHLIFNRYCPSGLTKILKCVLLL